MRANGLQDFRRVEWARAQSGTGSMAPKSRALETVLSSCATGTAFKLPVAQAKMLGQLAQKTCFRCKGTGVSKWRNGGHTAMVCRCVQTRLPAVQKALEEQQKAIQADLAAAKANKLEVHADACASSHGIECDCTPTYLDKEVNDALELKEVPDAPLAP